MTDLNREVFEFLAERASAADSPLKFNSLAQKDDWNPFLRYRLGEFNNDQYEVVSVYSPHQTLQKATELMYKEMDMTLKDAHAIKEMSVYEPYLKPKTTMHQVMPHYLNIINYVRVSSRIHNTKVVDMSPLLSGLIAHVPDQEAPRRISRVKEPQKSAAALVARALLQSNSKVCILLT
jgi:hypothetical protein